MKISKVTYKKNFIVNAMTMQHEHFQVEVDLNEGENSMEAVIMAKAFVHEAYLKTQVVVPDPEPGEMPVVVQDKVSDALKDNLAAINKTETESELKEYWLLSKSNLILSEAYKTKLKQFENAGSKE